MLCRFLKISNQTPAEIHHIEAVRDKYSDFAVVPLCTEHHRGKMVYMAYPEKDLSQDIN